MNKKIMILANSSGGLYDFRQELIKALMIQNKVLAATPFDLKVDELRLLGCELIETKMDRRGINPIKDIRLLVDYLFIIHKEKPDMIITYTIKPSIYGGLVCELFRIPYAANITGLGTSFQKKGMLRVLVKELYKLALRRAQTVFFENSENRDLFVREKIIKSGQAHLLHGAGVNLERFSLQPYPVDIEETRFLFMGRVMAEKGINELFSAMRMLRDDGINCSLDMIGYYDEDFEDKINQAEKEGWLRYHGYQSDVRPFIANCHCFVLPSWHEGMANTNLECAASGRPVITSNIHGCLEAVEDGISGYLCKTQNEDSLYQTMKRFAELHVEQRIAMGIAGRKRMEVIFDKKKVVEETIAYLS